MSDFMKGYWTACLVTMAILLLIFFFMSPAKADDDDMCKFKYEDAGSFLAHKNHDVIFRNGFENYCDDEEDGDDDNED